MRAAVKIGGVLVLSCAFAASAFAGHFHYYPAPYPGCYYYVQNHGLFHGYYTTDNNFWAIVESGPCGYHKICRAGWRQEADSLGTRAETYGSGTPCQAYHGGNSVPYVPFYPECAAYGKTFMGAASGSTIIPTHYNYAHSPC